MENTVEEYFSKGIKLTGDNKYFVCLRFDILLKKKNGKFYPVVNNRNLIFIQMSVSVFFFEKFFKTLN